MNGALPLNLSHTDVVISVTEENAIRAIVTMSEQTGGLTVGELLLPENYLQRYMDSTSSNEIEEDPGEMEIDELTEESEEEVMESDDGSDYGDEEGNSKGKGKARKKIKEPAKPASGTKTKPKKKPKPAGQVLNELVGYHSSCSRFWLMTP